LRERTHDLGLRDWAGLRVRADWCNKNTQADRVQSLRDDRTILANEYDADIVGHYWRGCEAAALTLYSEIAGAAR